MCGEKIIVSERQSREELVPVLTYVYGLSRSRAVSAWLSFLSVCHNDGSKNIRLPNILSGEDEILCTSLLDEAINSYLQIRNRPLSAAMELGRMVYKIVKNLSGPDRAFFSERLHSICGENGYKPYW
ncbi:MAG: hypothetical protein PHC61_17870, partial [Chitinivibrionales bacterium]|nr:hypothetical protein [Chitinivibrionales bacterium]